MRTATGLSGYGFYARKPEKKKEDAGCLWAALAGAVVVPGATLVRGAAVYFLWNALARPLTHGAAPELTFWQALGLTLLCGFLFRSGKAV